MYDWKTNALMQATDNNDGWQQMDTWVKDFRKASAYKNIIDLG